MERVCLRQGITVRRIPTLASRAIDRLMTYRWPGNVREIENAVERGLILAKGKPLTFADLEASNRKERPAASDQQPGESMKLDEVVSKQRYQALAMAGGRGEGRGGAAEKLGVKPGTLRQRMRKPGIPFGRKARNHYRHE